MKWGGGYYSVCLITRSIPGNALLRIPCRCDLQNLVPVFHGGKYGCLNLSAFRCHGLVFVCAPAALGLANIQGECFVAFWILWEYIRACFFHLVIDSDNPILEVMVSFIKFETCWICHGSADRTSSPRNDMFNIDLAFFLLTVCGVLLISKMNLGICWRESFSLTAVLSFLTRVCEKQWGCLNCTKGETCVSALLSRRWWTQIAYRISANDSVIE